MSAADSLGDQLQLLPFYLLADQSGSMESDIESLTGGLQDLVDEARSNSLAYSKIRLSVIGFGSSVTAHLELADLRKIDRMPVLPATEEYTRYDLAFEDLRVRIDRDVDLIKATNNAALRPAVFFLTDGKPNPPDQPWREALSTVRDDHSVGDQTSWPSAFETLTPTSSARSPADPTGLCHAGTPAGLNRRSPSQFHRDVRPHHRQYRHQPRQRKRRATGVGSEGLHGPGRDRLRGAGD